MTKKPKADASLSWLRKPSEPETKNTTKDDAEGRKCPVTRTYSCPTDNELTAGCSEC